MTFLSNHAKGSSVSGCGGGLYALGTSMIISGNLEFADNIANFDGGGMHVEAGRLYIEGTVSFVHNFGGGLGGGIHVAELQPMFVTGFMFLSDNHADSYDCSAKTGGSAGGGWRVMQSVVNITGEVLVINNSAQCEGGEISLVNSNVFASGNVSVMNNSAEAAGGFEIIVSNVTLMNAVVNGNSAIEGGGSTVEKGKLIISGEALFLNNGASYNGGGITIIKSILNITGSLNMTKNIANAYGGAIVTAESSEMFVYGDLLVAENNATSDDADGGGMTITDSTVNIFGTVMITDNLASHSGGGLWLNNSSLAIARKMQFVNNKALFGGAIFVKDI